MRSDKRSSWLLSLLGTLIYLLLVGVIIVEAIDLFLGEIEVYWPGERSYRFCFEFENGFTLKGGDRVYEGEDSCVI